MATKMKSGSRRTKKNNDPITSQPRFTRLDEYLKPKWWALAPRGETLRMRSHRSYCLAERSDSHRPRSGLLAPDRTSTVPVSRASLPAAACARSTPVTRLSQFALRHSMLLCDPFLGEASQEG